MLKTILFLALMLPTILSYSDYIKPVKLPFRSDIECMAVNAYHEARGESLKGIQAVIEVTHNRSVKSSKSICDVVYSPYQFSWTTKGKKQVPIDKLQEFKELVIGWYINPTNHTQGSTFYHATYVKPKWRFQKRKTVRIASHAFYSGEFR